MLNKFESTTIQNGEFFTQKLAAYKIIIQIHPVQLPQTNEYGYPEVWLYINDDIVPYVITDGFFEWDLEDCGLFNSIKLITNYSGNIEFDLFYEGKLVTEESTSSA